MDKNYIDTVRLLLECAPAVFEIPNFAMKGGTAINLFVQNLPRLSVDIDLVYTEHSATRAEALKVISSGLDRVRKQLSDLGAEVELSGTAEGEEFKLFIRRERSLVKVEVNHVFRGVLLPVEQRQLVPEARNIFTTELSVPVLAPEELYGGKIVAALDRQHPRDFFDLHGLLAGKGLTSEIVECFVCYLAGHNRPVHEVLYSIDQDLSVSFNNEFQGMTRIPTTLADLEKTREKLRRELSARISSNHRQFLIGLVEGAPDWRLMSCAHLSEMPAIRWKLQNLARLKNSNPRKFASQAEQLRVRFKG